MPHDWSTSEKRARSLVARLATAALCGALYWVVLQVFLAIPVLNQGTQVRPASGLSPVLGLFCGLPGAVGCTVANLIADLGSTSDPGLLASWTWVQLVYNTLPYLAWYAVMAATRAKDPYPRLDSTARLVLFMALMVANSFLFTLLSADYETTSFGEAALYTVGETYLINNSLFSIYLGIPLLAALDGSPLVPLSPLWVREKYAQRPYLNLTQRFSLALVIDTAVLIALYLVQDAQSIAELDSTGLEEGWFVSHLYSVALQLTVVVFVPMIAFLLYMEKRFTRPIERLSRASRVFVQRLCDHKENGAELAASKLSEEGITVRYEMRDLFDSTYQMSADLVGYLDRLEAATAERERTAAELDIARQIQLGSVPHKFGAIAEKLGFDVAAFMQPALEVGGDFYDAFDLGAGRLALIVADVSGKGMPAALFMMRALSLVRQGLLTLDDPGEVLTYANGRLCHNNEANLFVTAFVCVVDVGAGTLRYANAGHNPASLRRAGSRDYLRCKPGLVMGALNFVDYETGELDFWPGDSVVLYTDGVTEAQDTSSELYGEKRLANVLDRLDSEVGPAAKDGSGVPSDDVVWAIQNELADFAGEAPQADDITVVAARWNAPVARLEVAPEVARLGEVEAFVRDACEAAGPECGGKFFSSLMLAVEELFVNVCTHGFEDGRATAPVEFLATGAEGAVWLTMADAGRAFDPCAYEPQLVEAGRDNKIGGLGIHLARKNLTRMSYERDEARGLNVLRMLKRA